MALGECNQPCRVVSERGSIMDEDDIDLPILPRLDKGPPPDCPICGDPMSFIDGDWACVDCNGELLGPETG